MPHCADPVGDNDLRRPLHDYRWQIILVLLIMGYGVAVSLVNPLIMESAIDDHISVKDKTCQRGCAFT